MYEESVAEATKEYLSREQEYRNRRLSDNLRDGEKWRPTKMIGLIADKHGVDFDDLLFQL